MRGVVHMALLTLAMCWLGALTIGAASAESFPMQFRVEQMDAPGCGAKCPLVVVAEGVIEPETPGVFLEFAQSAALSQGLRGVVLMNSPGGNVVASMELGDAFRRLHLAAIVAGYASADGRSGPTAGECVSACVYALMGAVRRVAPAMSHVALHRMSVVLAEAPGRSLSGGSARRFADKRLVALVASYARRMGVSPSLVYTAESLPADQIHILSQNEISRSHLATSQF